MHKHVSSDTFAARNEQPAASLRQAQTRIAELEAQLAEMHRRERALEQRIAACEMEEPSGPTAQAALSSVRLDSLLAVGAALLVTHEIEPILDLIIRKSTNLFPGTEGVLLFLEDPETCHLMLRAAEHTRVTELSLSAQKELGCQHALAPRSLLLSGDDARQMLDNLHSGLQATLQQTLDTWPPTGALLAPLRDEHRCMGGLLLYHTTSTCVYHTSDLPFIQALADLAAVAITETYQRARAAALQRDLAQIQFLHREAQARLDAAQAQLLQSAKLAAIGELSASVAHEINNPLYAARNSLYLLEQDLPLNPNQRQFLDIAQGELGRIARIITRMRDFYRPSRSEFAPTDVNSLLQDTVEFVQTYLRHSHIRVFTELTDTLPPLIAHMDQLRQVFLNIVLNACDAMPAGGRLGIRTEHIPATADEMTTIVVYISDTGTGISDEHMAHLFEPFYTTKPQGTGLGLAISAHIVTQHAGQISVDSAMGSGSTFIIKLPVTEDTTDTTPDL